jgi:predicted urease superfamily metal-dependent hydrolase
VKVQHHQQHVHHLGILECVQQHINDGDTVKEVGRLGVPDARRRWASNELSVKLELRRAGEVGVNVYMHRRSKSIRGMPELTT